MISGIWKNIFSVEDADFSHKLIRILGFRFRIIKSEIKNSNVIDYLQFDNVSQIPKAGGFLRLYQLGLLEILKEFDRVCTINNVKYWLSGGTLLGAKRHGGFIPWDDDVDVDMMRDDFENFAQTFNNSTNNPDLYCEIYQDKNAPATYILKIKHRKIRQIFLDIFPHDFYIKSVQGFEKKFLNFQIRAVRKFMSFMPFKIPRARILFFTKFFINNNIKPNEKNKPSIHWGLEFPHRWSNWIYDYDQIFPLQKIKFEGYEFWVPNDTDFMLRNIYGDYMKLPNKIYPHHTDEKLFTKDEMDELLKLGGNCAEA